MAGIRILHLGDSIDELQLEFQSEEMVEFNNELIPTQNLIPYQDLILSKKLGQLF